MFDSFEPPKSDAVCCYELIFDGRNAKLTLLLFSAIKDEIDGKFLKFVAVTIAMLPFSLLAEPLHAIYCINRIISLKGGVLLASMKMIFDKTGGKFGDN